MFETGVAFTPEPASSTQVPYTVFMSLDGGCEGYYPDALSSTERRFEL